MNQTLRDDVGFAQWDGLGRVEAVMLPITEDWAQMAGRKPLPTEVKRLKGTLQKCRTNPHEPQPTGELMEPPAYMTEGAKSAWRYALECAPPQLLRRLDMSVLEVWAYAVQFCAAYYATAHCRNATV